MTEMAILFDSSKCTGCKGCQVACKCWNNLPSYMKGANAKEDFTGTYQNPPDLNGTTRLIMTFDERDGAGQKPVEWAFGRRSCMHCEDAPCATVCSGGALVRKEDTGFVEVDQSKCVGCKYCLDACPYDVPRYDGDNSILGRAVINKCTGCGDRVEHGMAPACVSTCQPQALRFGTREAHLKRGNGQILQSLSPDFLLDYLGIVLDGERAQALSLRLNLLVTDGGETYRYLLELRCGTLLVYHGGRDDAARTLTVTKDVLAALVHKQLDTVQGQIPDADMELLRGIETYVTDLDHQPPFHVVEP